MNGERQDRQWRYDPGERPKKKHGWNKDEAGFVRSGQKRIGKFPHTLQMGTAQDLLNTGIAIQGPRDRSGHPRRIYVVHEGVLYRAVPTVPGLSYHGFPEWPEEFERLDGDLKERIWQRARELGCLDDLKRWLRKIWK